MKCRRLVVLTLFTMLAACTTFDEPLNEAETLPIIDSYERDIVFLNGAIYTVR
jgi:hypothetical protein